LSLHVSINLAEVIKTFFYCSSSNINTPSYATHSVTNSNFAALQKPLSLLQFNKNKNTGPLMKTMDSF
jgi:hypothetical protein